MTRILFLFPHSLWSNVGMQLWIWFEWRRSLRFVCWLSVCSGVKEWCMLDFGFSWQHILIWQPSVMWCHVVWWTDIEVFEEPAASTFGLCSDLKIGSRFLKNQPKYRASHHRSYCNTPQICSCHQLLYLNLFQNYFWSLCIFFLGQSYIGNSSFEFFKLFFPCP
jgi:hypothetical protein